MLWSTLLDSIEKFIIRKPDNPGSQTLVYLAKIDNVELHDMLQSYDIKRVEKLRTIIPDAFPRPLRYGALMGDQNIHGAWRVKPMPRDHLPTKAVIL